MAVASVVGVGVVVVSLAAEDVVASVAFLFLINAVGAQDLRSKGFGVMGKDVVTFVS